MKLSISADREAPLDAVRRSLCAAMWHSYSGTVYANPDAVTQIANGLSTSTFAYDNNGNVVQKTVDGTSTTYVWDYANRLIALGVTGQGTTTYGYDPAGNRVLQTGTSTTYVYPFKWYSIASSTGAGAKYSTSTEYVFNGDTLVSTIDQQMAGGVATGIRRPLNCEPGIRRGGVLMGFGQRSRASLGWRPVLSGSIRSCGIQKVLLNRRMQGGPPRFSTTERQSPPLGKQSDSRAIVLILGHGFLR
jgi:YD repeat-containing protein